MLENDSLALPSRTPAVSSPPAPQALQNAGEEPGDRSGKQEERKLLLRQGGPWRLTSDSKGGFALASPRVPFPAWSHALYLESLPAPETTLGHRPGRLGRGVMTKVGISLGYYRRTGFLQGRLWAIGHRLRQGCWVFGCKPELRSPSTQRADGTGRNAVLQRVPLLLSANSDKLLRRLPTLALHVII